MPYISNKQIKTLIEVENYLGCKESWSENTNKIWAVIEDLLNRQQKENERQKLWMRERRKVDPQYGRDVERARAYQREYNKKHRKEIAEYRAKMRKINKERNANV